MARNDVLSAIDGVTDDRLPARARVHVPVLDLPVARSNVLGAVIDVTEIAYGHGHGRAYDSEGFVLRDALGG